jgi:hypothetical protein
MYSNIIQRWNGSFFEPSSLQSLGLVVQLNHLSGICPLPVAARQDFKVLHVNGVHNITLKFCGCTKQIPHDIQLLRRALYPSTQIFPRTCASFRLLEFLHMLTLTSKVSTYDAYRTLEKLTCNTGLYIPKVHTLCDCFQH